MPYYNQNIFRGGVDPETIRSIVWLVICSICIIACVCLIISVHSTVIKRYKELKKVDEPAKRIELRKTDEPAKKIELSKTDEPAKKI